MMAELQNQAKTCLFVTRGPSGRRGWYLEDRYGSYLQILPTTVRHIRGTDKEGSSVRPAEEINFSSNQEIVVAATNRRQVALGLKGGILVYLEMDNETGSFNEIQRIEIGVRNVPSTSEDTQRQDKNFLLSC